MIQVEINRWTIMQLEKAIEKYNNIKGHYRIADYADMISKLAEIYLKASQSRASEKDCECDCHMFVGGSGKPCPQCVKEKCSYSRASKQGGKK